MNRKEAQAITSRIRKWVDACPVEDIMQAFEGRVWEPLGYLTWGEWCDGELGGFNLPAPQRKAAVSDLAGRGMSNRAIAEVVGASRRTVDSDVKSGGQNCPPGKVTGQDGKTYPRPQPVEPDPADEIVYTPQGLGQRQAFELMAELNDLSQVFEKTEAAIAFVKELVQRIRDQGPYGDQHYLDRLQRMGSELNDAQNTLLSAQFERVTE
jgi:hypothetical protein